MISNWFYYCFAIIAATFILSSCLDSNNNNEEYEYSADAQITSLRLSSNQDSLKVLSGVNFSIDQVSSAPVIFNRDSLPYLFDVSMVSMAVTSNRASGIKIHLASPGSADSSYIWNMTDSVMIKKLKRIEVFAEDGKTTKTYTFQLRTHQQDPDTILWQNVKNNYITQPTDQATVSNNIKFFTYYKSNSTLKLSTSSITDGKTWTNQLLSGLPQNVLLSSIQNSFIEEKEVWYALDSSSKVYISNNGIGWNETVTPYSVKSIFGKMPSYTKDSILVIVKDGDKYKFAKTINFSTIHVINEIPMGFPVEGFTFTTIKDSLNYTAKYLITTGGKDLNNLINNSVWILQENENDNKITSTSKNLNFNVTGSTLFKYDKKIYLMTFDGSKNSFYTSTNYGVYWEKASNKQSLPTGFTSRKNQNVTIDSENNIWIFGGITANQTQLVEIWKGRINKYFYK